MGNSFPFWHLNNRTFLAIGVFVGFIIGSIISVLVWVALYPRS